VRKQFRPVSLDAVNFLLADVRGALGPYLNVFLTTQQHWSQANVGWVTMISGVVGLAVQTPIGAGIDRIRAKRGIILLSLVAIAVGAIVVWSMPTFWPVLVANSLMAVAGDVLGPAVAAITLGLFLSKDLPRRLGRNSAFDHAGNVAAAIVAGAIGWGFGQRAVFLLVPVFGVMAASAVLSIPGGAIDHERARGADKPEGRAAVAQSGWAALIRHRPLVIFAGSALLFHFANAPLLPLVGQKLALANPQYATAMMSACIVAAQLIMLPIALFVGHTADRFGRRPILLAGFAILPVRAALYILSDNPAWLIAIQLLDGVGAGIVGALTPLILADIMRGTGRYNLAQGAVATVQGIGASVSGLAVGLVVDRLGYAAGFLMSSAAAAIAFVALLVMMPETGRSSQPQDAGKVGPGSGGVIDGSDDRHPRDRPAEVRAGGDL
jgi:MFS family permease